MLMFNRMFPQISRSLTPEVTNNHDFSWPFSLVCIQVAELRRVLLQHKYAL